MTKLFCKHLFTLSNNVTSVSCSHIARQSDWIYNFFCYQEMLAGKDPLLSQREGKTLRRKYEEVNLTTQNCCKFLILHSAREECPCKDPYYQGGFSCNFLLKRQRPTLVGLITDRHEITQSVK